MLWNTSHLLLLDPDKLHFTDLMFHREDAAPDRLEGRRQSQLRVCSFQLVPGGPTVSSTQKSVMMLPHRKLGINLQIRLNCFNCQLDWKRVISVITSLCCVNHFSGDIRAPDHWWSSPSESRWLWDNYCSDWLRFSTSQFILSRSLVSSGWLIKDTRWRAWDDDYGADAHHDVVLYVCVCPASMP